MQPTVAQTKRQEKACGCALCLSIKNPTLDQMLESVALHGRPADKVAARSKVMVLDVDALAAMPRHEAEPIVKAACSEQIAVDCFS